MARFGQRLAPAAAICAALLPALRAQGLKPETLRAFDCYVQSAEARLEARKPFLLADADAGLKARLLRGSVETVAPNGPHPHKIVGGMIYDWIASVFIPGVTLDHTIAMLEDYDHRAQYFPDLISSAKLLCRTGDNRFGFTMRLKEPSVIDVTDDVVWQRVDPHRWQCRSWSTDVREAGKQHNYLHGLDSVWRFAETEKGVFVESETITLSGEFGSLARALGSMMGINPEKSLRRTLEDMRDSARNTTLRISPPPQGVAACGEPFRPAGCAATSRR
jgi:hypothetical protein